MSRTTSPGGGPQGSVSARLRTLYPALKRMAARHLDTHLGPVSLCPTDLAHEVYLRLSRSTIRNQDRDRTLMVVAARATRQVLVSHVRRRMAQKRKPPASPQHGEPAAASDEELLHLHESLKRLARLSPVQARIVELRFFGGLTMDEISDLLILAKRSVEREWQLARAWLHRDLAS